jgi:hypothetical protein
MYQRDALADLTPKLAKLIPRLGSNHDGEVVATAEAIIRTLAAAGLDLHDLARALAGDEPDAHEIDAREMLAHLREYSAYIPTEWEEGFLAGCTRRLRSCGKLTPKQFAMLRKIYSKARCAESQSATSSPA